MRPGFFVTSTDGSMDLRSDQGYLPIADYGIVGNLRTSALVGRNGSIDWCCLPDLDSPSVFGALLDQNIGGRFRIAPAAGGRGEQRYVRDTAVLVTRFETDSGGLEITDFMRPGRAGLYRVARCIGGTVDLALEWAPRLDYARAVPDIDAGPGGFVAAAGAARVALSVSRPGARTAVLVDGPAVVMECVLGPGDVVSAVSAWGGEIPAVTVEESLRACADTITWWHRWVESAQHGLLTCSLRGQYILALLLERKSNVGAAFAAFDHARRRLGEML